MTVRAEVLPPGGFIGRILCHLVDNGGGLVRARSFKEAVRNLGSESKIVGDGENAGLMPTLSCTILGDLAVNYLATQYREAHDNENPPEGYYASWRTKQEELTSYEEKVATQIGSDATIRPTVVIDWDGVVARGPVVATAEYCRRSRAGLTGNGILTGIKSCGRIEKETLRVLGLLSQVANTSIWTSRFRVPFTLWPFRGAIDYWPYFSTRAIKRLRELVGGRLDVVTNKPIKIPSVDLAIDQLNEIVYGRWGLRKPSLVYIFGSSDSDRELYLNFIKQSPDRAHQIIFCDWAGRFL